METRNKRVWGGNKLMELISKVPTDEELENYYLNLVLPPNSPWEPYQSTKDTLHSFTTQDWGDWNSYRFKLSIISSIIQSLANEFDHDDENPHSISSLDIGFGLGYYLMALSQFTDVVYGVEINKYNLNYAQRCIDAIGKNRNIVLIYSSIRKTLPTFNAKINIILALDIIEHLNDPFLFLQHIKNILDGYLIISVPLNEKKEFKDDFRENHGHIWSFTRNSIQKLLTDNGYIIDYLIEYDAKRFKPFNDCIIVAIKEGTNPPGYMEEQVDLYG